MYASAHTICQLDKNDTIVSRKVSLFKKKIPGIQQILSSGEEPTKKIQFTSVSLDASVVVFRCRCR